jgi:pimeloyl-ACP methyl ester carboxylesterase
MLSTLLVSWLVLQTSAPVGPAVEWVEVARDALQPLRFAIARPAGGDAEPSSRVVLAMPESSAREALERAVREVSMVAGVGACVVATTDPLRESLEVVAELQRRSAVPLNRPVVVGWGTGATAALRLVGFAPEDFGGVVVLAPGALEPEDLARLDAAVGLPMALLRGRADAREPLLAVLERRALLGDDATLDYASTCETVALDCNEERVRERLFAFLSAEARRAQAEAQVRARLDEFHAAASRADFAGYFACLAPDAVFLGTDATERWTVPQFRAFCEPYFSKGRGWTYVARERHVRLSREGTSAWFDERLDSASYGEVRGSGALRLDGGTWRVTQYVMSLPVPNDLAKDLVERIRAKR